MENSYKKKCKKIRQKIRLKYPNLKFTNEQRFDNLRELSLVDYKANIVIIKENTWKDIDKTIEQIITEKYKNNDCSICFNEIKINVRCNFCRKNWCVDCYINLFKTGKGIIKCPFFRYEYRYLMNKEQICAGVRSIRIKT